MSMFCSFLSSVQQGHVSQGEDGFLVLSPHHGGGCSFGVQDEPTSGLDARAAAIVMRTVKNTVLTGDAKNKQLFGEGEESALDFCRYW